MLESDTVLQMVVPVDREGIGGGRCNGCGLERISDG